MNFLILKKISILSFLLGVVLGIVSLIPYINFFTFLTLIFAMAPIIVIFMKKNNMLGYIDMKTGSIYGLVSGFISLIGFAISFVPLAALIGIFYKNGVYLAMNIFFKAAGGIMAFLLILIMTGILIGIFNSFSGAFIAYIYEQQEKQIQKKHESFEIDN